MLLEQNSGKLFCYYESFKSLSEKKIKGRKGKQYL